MHLPALVTFTGVDDATDLDRLAALSDGVAVEWGVLLSASREGEGRYPHRSLVRHLPFERARFAVHVCGAWAREINATGRCPEIEPLIQGRFARVQVNVAAEANPEMVAAFAAYVGARGILQCRGEFPADPTVQWLFDMSGGRGMSPLFWPKLRPGIRGGFAGGLSPENVATMVERQIAPAAAGEPYWIDMENGVRTDDRFDLARCEQVLKNLAALRDHPAPVEAG